MGNIQFKICYSHTMQLIDLTHPLSAATPMYDLDCGFKLSLKVDYQDCTAPNVFRVQQIETLAGVGTHIDAPAHCFPDGRTIEQLELQELVVDCVVIHIPDADERTIIMPAVIDQFEQQHGKIEPNAFVLFHTGWDVRWDTPEHYRNNLVFPSVHESTAQLLIDRDIAGLGIDTLSADSGGVDFPVHRIILGAGKYLVENVASAKNLPPTGAKVFVLPMKINDGTEAPIRLIATY